MSAIRFSPREVDPRISTDVPTLLRQLVRPDRSFTCRRGSPEEDRRGIDYQVESFDGYRYNIDTKDRFGNRGRCDDFALELISVIETQTIGWTLDDSKLTDYAVWIFHRDDTRRYDIVPYRPLRSAFKYYRDVWIRRFGTFDTESFDDLGRRWHSRAVFVPRNVLQPALLQFDPTAIIETGRYR